MMINKESRTSFFTLFRVVRELTVKMEDSGRKRYFAIDDNVSITSITSYELLSEVDIADKLDIDNKMNHSDTEHVAKEEIQPEKDTPDTSIITAKANTRIVSTDAPNKKSKKNEKKKNEGV